MSHQQVYVVAEVTAKEESADEMWDHVLRLIGPCRSEQGNVSYNALRDVDDPAHFLFTEAWESAADFDGHLNSAPRRTRRGHPRPDRHPCANHDLPGRGLTR